MDKKIVKHNPMKSSKSATNPIEIKMGNSVYRPFRITYSLMALLYKLASDMEITIDDALALILSSFANKGFDADVVSKEDEQKPENQPPQAKES